jgi:RimJ/RimL family protein N-acetyltransferase
MRMTSSTRYQLRTLVDASVPTKGAGRAADISTKVSCSLPRARQAARCRVIYCSRCPRRISSPPSDMERRPSSCAVIMPAMASTCPKPSTRLTNTSRPSWPGQSPTRASSSANGSVEFRGRWLLATDFALGIWQLDESRLLGGCGYHLREGPLHLGNAEIGMWIRAEAAGRGLGTAALRALLRWGFSEWPWVRLSWRCSAANEASQRVATKAGLQREGVLRSHAVDPDGSRRDTVCYVALRAEWIDAGNPSVGP